MSWFEAIRDGIDHVVSGVASGWQWIAARVADPDSRYVVATLAGTAGLALLLPGGARGRVPRAIAIALVAAAAVIGVMTGRADYGVSLMTAMVWLLSGLAILGAVAMISSRKPVYSALWFALTVLAVGGLFFVAGAPFLGVATVAVYAGAIVVTFLFVLMLAQPEGHTFYDRTSWGRIPRWLASLMGMSMAFLIAWSTTGMIPATSEVPTAIAESEHVAALGGYLFSKYLVEVQVAGTLLLVALVGAVSIAAQRVTRPSMAMRIERATMTWPGSGVVDRD